MKLSQGKVILLFRFHDNPKLARHRLEIVRHFNPELDFYALYGGEPSDFEVAKETIKDLVISTWLYAKEKPKDWKWQHTDLILKNWYREVGSALDFDFLYSYEYDLLTLRPLNDFYPDIDDKTIALAACEPFTKEIEKRWSWTSKEPHREQYLAFCDYLQETYGFSRQEKVCLGPGPLFSKKFLDAWSKTEDIEFVHDELAYPAYAQALGFKTVSHQMHPGFGKTNEETKYFNCHSDRLVTLDMIRGQLSVKQGRRSFHPVKQDVTLQDLGIQ